MKPATKLLGQRFLDNLPLGIIDHVLAGAPATDWLAFAINQEFREIPLDHVDTEQTGAVFVLLEVEKELGSVFAVDVGSLEENNVFAPFLADLVEQLLTFFRLLAAELVARLADDDQAFVGVVSVELFYLPIHTFSFASLTCDICDQQDLAFVFFERNLFILS